jgi:hypothetical protein
MKDMHNKTILQLDLELKQAKENNLLVVAPMFNAVGSLFFYYRGNGDSLKLCEYINRNFRACAIVCQPKKHQKVLEILRYGYLELHYSNSHIHKCPVNRKNDEIQTVANKNAYVDYFYSAPSSVHMIDSLYYDVNDVYDVELLKTNDRRHIGKIIHGLPDFD